jgi:cyclohexanecarboxylate-CoA ligase
MDRRLENLIRANERPVSSRGDDGLCWRRPLWERVRDAAASEPARPAIIDGERIISYRELWRDALGHSAALRSHGAEERDIVLVQLPNWHEFVVLAVAAEIARVVFAFCPIQWGLRETARALRLIKPKIWFTTRYPRENDDRASLIQAALREAGSTAPAVVLARSQQDFPEGTFLDSWRGMAEVDPAVPISGGGGADPLEIAVTSGSTGEPKGVLHTHNSALATVDSTIRRQGIGPADIIHLAVPMGHTFGYFYGVRCALQACGALLLQSRWDAQTMLTLAERHKPTVSLGPSAFMIDLLGLEPSSLAQLSSLRFFTLAGDSLPAPTVRRAVTTMPFRISRALGMTEFGHVCSTDAKTPIEATVNTLGSAQPEMTVAIFDEQGREALSGMEGRIMVKGPFLFAGYLKEGKVDQAVLDPHGFFDTGDLGVINDEGFLLLTGRVKNVIRRGAETVPVGLLEDVIASHPDVLNAVVVGIADERLGEAPFACVQLRPGANLSFGDVERLFAQQQVTKKFWPVGMKVFDEWPTGPTGKIDRRMILSSLSQST